MVAVSAVRRLAAALPGAVDESTDEKLVFSAAGKGFAWTYLVRSAPRKPRLPRLDVLAIRCPIEQKEFLIEAAPETYFDDDHYRGYPAVLVRLDKVGRAELKELLRRALEMQAAKPNKRGAQNPRSKTR